MSAIKYLIEDRRTSKWLCIGEPFIHSYLHGTLSGDFDSKWTNEANNAIQWDDRDEAERYRKSYLDLPDIEVTEHEFI